MNIWIVIASIAGGIGLFGLLNYIFNWGIFGAVMEILADVADILADLFSAIGNIGSGD